MPQELMKLGQTSVIVMDGESADAPQQTSLVKLTPQGLVHHSMTNVQLRKDKSEVWEMPYFEKGAGKGGGGWKKRAIITAAGYYRMNTFAGVSFSSPETLLGDDGQPKGNPFTLRNELGEVLSVKVRRIGVGRNPVGNLVAFDYTITFDLRLYLAQDLLSRWSGKRNEQPRDWGQLFASEAMIPDDLKLPHMKPVHVPGGLVLVVDLRQPDVISIFSEHCNREKFAERNAATICERNILKRFFAAAIVDESLKVPVVSWPQMDVSTADLRRLTDDMKDGKLRLGDETDIPVDSQAIVAEPDDVEAALADEIDEGQVIDAEVEQPPEEEMPAQDELLKQLRADLRKQVDRVGGRPVAADVLAREQVGVLADIIDGEDPQVLSDAIDVLGKQPAAKGERQGTLT